MAGTDFSHLTTDELIKGIKALDLPDYIRTKAYGIDVRETLAQMTEMLMQLAYNQGMDLDQAQEWVMQIAKIDDKADQSFVDSQLSAIVSGAPKGTFTDLKALRTAHPNGTDGVFLVLENGHWYYWNAVTAAWTDGGLYMGATAEYDKKLTDLGIKLKGNYNNAINLADYDNRVTGKYINDSGVATDAPTTTYYLPKIAIKPSTAYTFPKILGSSGVWVDSDNAVIAPINQDAVSYAITLVSPAKATGVFFNGDGTLTKETCVITEGNYYDYVSNRFNVAEKKVNKLSDTLVFSENNLINLADYDNRISGEYVMNDGTIGTTNSLVYHLPKITVKPSTSYSFPKIVGTPGVWLDTNNAVISRLGTSSLVPTSRTSPENAKYLLYNGDGDVTSANCMIVEGTVFPTTFIPYDENAIGSFYIDNLKVKEDNLSREITEKLNTTNPSKWIGKTWTAVGDSITEKNVRANLNYHDYIKQIVPMTVVNRGISGTGYYGRYNVANDITETPDLITVFLGTNDFGQAHNNLPLGQFGDTTSDTVAGCIHLMYSQLTNKFYNKTIAVFTPLPRANNWGINAAPNAVGYTLEDLVELIKLYCEHFSIPCLDLYHESNLPVYTTEGNKYYFTAPSVTEPDGLHPNDNGHRVIADKVLAFINSL